jgi:hypothetical protein
MESVSQIVNFAVVEAIVSMTKKNHSAKNVVDQVYAHMADKNPAAKNVKALNFAHTEKGCPTATNVKAPVVVYMAD